MASVIFIAISLHVRFSSGVINIDLLFVLLVLFSCSFERWTKQILHAILRLKNYLFDTNVFQIILKSDLMVQFKISTFLSLGTGKTNGGKRKASERKRSESLKHIKKVRKTNCLKRIKNVQIGILVSWMVSAGFAPWRVCPHIDSSSDQVLQIYLSHTEKKVNIVRTMKQNMFIFHSLIHRRRLTNSKCRKFRMSSWGQTHWGRIRHGAKPV